MGFQARATAPVTQQPTRATGARPQRQRVAQMQWMPPPPLPAGCPPGLEYLSTLDRLYCHQLLEPIEMLTGFETNNRYVLMNAFGQPVYYAIEQSSMGALMCCGADREFTIVLLDAYGRQVGRFFRPFKCFAGCLFGSLSPHEVSAMAAGMTIGQARQTPALCETLLHVWSANASCVVHGPGLRHTCAFLADQQFPVVDASGKHVGSIVKHFGGVARELFSDADNFSIFFPPTLDVKLKAALVGSTFLIDFVAFQKRQKSFGMSF